jgi:hypothetical protein
MGELIYAFFIVSVVLMSTFFNTEWRKDGIAKYILSVVGAAIFLGVMIALAF